MTWIDDLVTELRQYKTVFVPVDTDKVYKTFLWDYYSWYCELKGLGKLENLCNVIKCAMRVHIKSDIESAKQHYDKSARLYKIWLPDKNCIGDYVRQQITQEDNLE